MITFSVDVIPLNGRVTRTMPVSIPAPSFVYDRVVDTVSMVSL